MKQLFSQIKWQFVLLQRNNIILISIIVTAIYAGIFLLIREAGNMEKVLTLLILNDPAMIGLFFIGVMIIIEKNQQVLTAFFVTPISSHVYLISRVLALSMVCWMCAIGMAVSAIGFDFNLVHFSAGVLGVSVLSCLAGLFIVSFTSEFMPFTLKSIPILLFFINIPLLNYFEITNWPLFRLFPAQGSLDLIIGSYKGTADPGNMLFAYLATSLWISALYLLVHKTFKNKITNT